MVYENVRMITSLPTMRISAIPQWKSKTFITVLPGTRWRRKPASIEIGTVTLCIVNYSIRPSLTRERARLAACTRRQWQIAPVVAEVWWAVTGDRGDREILRSFVSARVCNSQPSRSAAFYDSSRLLLWGKRTSSRLNVVVTDAPANDWKILWHCRLLSQTLNLFLPRALSCSRRLCWFLFILTDKSLRQTLSLSLTRPSFLSVPFE